jgi:hypothetical protein
MAPSRPRSWLQHARRCGRDTSGSTLNSRTRSREFSNRRQDREGSRRRTEWSRHRQAAAPSSAPLTLEIPHLRQIFQSIGARKETHRLHLGAHRRAILVAIQGRGGVSRVPLRRPTLIAFGAVKGPALLVVAFRRGKCEALAHLRVVREQIPSQGFLRRGLAPILGHDIDDAGRVVDPDEEGLRASRHQSAVRCAAIAPPPRRRRPAGRAAPDVGRWRRARIPRNALLRSSPRGSDHRRSWLTPE